VTEGQAGAFEVGNLYSEEFLPVLGIPNPDVVERGRGKDVGVVLGEANIINFIKVTGISEFWR